MLDDENVVRLLMQANVLSPFRLNQARRLQRQTGTPLYDVLLEHKLVEEDRALQAIGAHTATPCVSLRDFEGDEKLLDRVPRELAQAYRVLPIGLMTDGELERLYLAMVDPSDLAAMESISQATGYDVEPVLVGPLDLRSALARVYGEHETDTRFEEAEGAQARSEFPELGEWDNLELDGESNDFLRELFDDDAPPSAEAEDDVTGAAAQNEGSGRATEVLDSSPPPLRDTVAANVFREFMTRSAVAILSPLQNEVLHRRTARHVGSRDLLQSVVRVLIRRGIITEKEVMDELAESRKRRKRGDR
jgi:hypothetical protein